jgi:GNAT superfamily N-acetyltransferase
MAVIHREATAAEVALIAEWAAREGWNPGLADAEAFRAADPSGFRVAELDGEIAATISLVRHSDVFAFLGFYICRPDHRGRGIGFGLWQHAIDLAGDRIIGLDGVAEQEGNYARSGFVRAGASSRWVGQLDAAPHAEIRAAESSDLATLQALDAAAWGVCREAFVRAWASPHPDRRTVLRADGSGWATARRCREGVKIGPIVADSTDAALELASAALHALAPEGAAPIAIDLPEPAADLAAQLAARGFAVTFATARMYRRAAPELGPTAHAIASMELG